MTIWQKPNFWHSVCKNKRKQKRIMEKEQNIEEMENAATEAAEVNEQVAAEEETAQEEVNTAALEERIAELEDKNLRLMAEYENYRRRTQREKLELMANAGERIFKEMLPLVDDFERAATHGDLSEGGQLIYKKFLSFLDSQDVHVIETEGVAFDTDLHEAITTFAAGEDKKGQIIDCTQKGYKLGEKVIRFAKVVVGE